MSETDNLEAAKRLLQEPNAGKARVAALEPEVRSNAGWLLNGSANLPYLNQAIADGKASSFMIVWGFDPVNELGLLDFLKDNEPNLFNDSFTPDHIRYRGCYASFFGDRKTPRGSYQIIWHVDSLSSLETSAGPPPTGFGDTKFAAFHALMGALESFIEVIYVQPYQLAAGTSKVGS